MMAVTESPFAEDFREEPWWWTSAPRPKEPVQPLPERVDVAVVGSGYTGLSAALTLARAGREVVVMEAGVPGEGASSRNAGYVGKTLKHSFASLLAKHGERYAVEVYQEVAAAHDYVLELIQSEQIECHYERNGRYMAALSPSQYEAMASDLELKQRYLGQEAEMVPRAQQHREIGSDRYYGGAVIPELGCVHPGLYHLGLLEHVVNAEVRVIANTPVVELLRDDRGFTVVTDRGRFRARDVVVATNGYTGRATPWLRRRVVPFHAWVIVTEELDEERLQRVLPNARVFHDFNNNLEYMRRLPDAKRLLFGGLTGTVSGDLRGMAMRLHAKLRHNLPELDGVRISRAWTGQGAGTLDMWPHIGHHSGLHYAMGYCFAGLPMGTYLGHKLALQMIGDPQGETLFAEREFPSNPLYWGNPWFVPGVMKYYDWQDRRSMRG